MIGHDAARYRESETRAVLARRKIGSEDTSLVVRRDAASGIADGQPCHSRITRELTADSKFRRELSRKSFERVIEKIREYASHLQRVQ